jgi:hypothetical protein
MRIAVAALILVFLPRFAKVKKIETKRLKRILPLKIST